VLVETLRVFVDQEEGRRGGEAGRDTRANPSSADHRG
jgi:hypothetical protein